MRKPILNGFLQSDLSSAGFQIHDILGSDNSLADTAAIQAIIDRFGVGGGIIRTKGTVSISMDGLNFPALTSILRFEIYGNWRLANTLTVPDNVELVGLGGGALVQFQRAGPVAGIIPPPGNIPTLHLVGINHILIKNLSIYNCVGIGILCYGLDYQGSMIQIENVGILSAPNSTSTCVVMQDCIWVWMKNCTFLHAGTLPYSLRMTGQNLEYGTGLIHLDDSIIAGKGLQFDSQVSTQRGGGFMMRNVVAESLTGPLITIDQTNFLPFSRLSLDNVEPADQTAMTSIINVTGTGAPGKVRNVAIHNCPSLLQVLGTGNNGPLVVGPEIDNLLIEGGPDTQYGTGWKIGDNQHSYTLVRSGKFTGKWSGTGADMAPSITPYDTLPVNQDASTWGSLPGTAVVTTGVRAPDGSLTAATLSGASDLYRNVLNTTLPVTIGDTIIAGVWLKSADPTIPVLLAPAMGMSASDGTVTLVGDETFRVGASWQSIVRKAKVTFRTDPDLYYFYLHGSTANPISYWKPWAIRIPAALGLTDDETSRIANHLVNVVSGTPAGALAIYPHVPLYAGRIIHQVITAFAAAATTPSVAAGDWFKTANTAATTITDFTNGTNGQEIAVLMDGYTTIANSGNIITRSGADIAPTAITNIFVSGAGTGAANGRYTYRNMFDGKPYYNLFGQPDSTTLYVIIWYASLVWSIFDSAGQPYYSSFDNVATPDQVTTWEAGAAGAAPVPAVSANRVTHTFVRFNGVWYQKN